MREYNIDLHIHTCLSPCADLLMTPGNIIKTALKQGLDIIAITDHNSARNVEVAIELAEDTPLTIIPGMEVESAEEVHLLCLFERVEDLLSWEEVVYSSLPDLINDEDYFGYQLITDQYDEYINKEDRLLATATGLSINEVVERVHGMGGVVIPSHIDRPYNSLIANLGFIPDEAGFTLLEVSRKGSPDKLLARYPFLQKYTLVTNSDSHYLGDLGPGFKLKLEKMTPAEIISQVQKGKKNKANLE